jgi:hypothetical protein
MKSREYLMLHCTRLTDKFLSTRHSAGTQSDQMPSNRKDSIANACKHSHHYHTCTSHHPQHRRLPNITAVQTFFLLNRCADFLYPFNPSSIHILPDCSWAASCVKKASRSKRASSGSEITKNAFSFLIPTDEEPSTGGVNSNSPPPEAVTL